MALGAPAAPEVGLTFGLILLGIACVLLLALNKVWEYTLGALLGSMANMISSLPQVSVLGHQVPPWNALASGINDLDNYVLQAIGYGIAKTEAGMHAIVSWMVWVLQATADEVAGLAEDTYNAFKSLRQYHLPKYITASLASALAAIHLLKGQVEELLAHPVRAVHTTVRVIAPGIRALEGKVSTLEAKVAALATAGVAANPIPIIERVATKPLAIPQDIYRGIDSLWRDVKRIGKIVTPVGIAGLVAGAVLATLKIPWLKCRNVDKAGRALCGMNADVLEGLLAGLLALFGTFSLVEFARYLQGPVKVVGGEVTHFWRADVANQGGDRQLGSPTLG